MEKKPKKKLNLAKKLLKNNNTSKSKKKVSKTIGDNEESSGRTGEGNDVSLDSSSQSEANSEGEEEKE